MITQFNDYRSVIRFFSQQNEDIRGYQTKMAEASGCQRSTFSQVLAEKKDLTIDQASQLSDFWELGDIESEYFICLVLIERAGSTNLRLRWEKRLIELRNKFENLGDRYNFVTQMDKETQRLFYSSYTWALVATALGVPELRTTQKLSQRFGLREDKVREILESLESQGIVARDNVEWRSMIPHSFLPRNSEMIIAHHTNWHAKALHDIHQLDPDSLHYSGVMAIDEESFSRIKRILIEAVDRKRAVVENAPEKDLYCFVLDWFRVH